MYRRGASSHSKTPGVVVFDDVVSSKALYAAWRKFSRGKGSRRDVAKYKRNLPSNLTQLHKKLVFGQYRHGPYQRFTIHDLKQRQIHKATVEDRIVHQAIVNAIEPLFETRFIHDSYSCRVGKGSHAGVRRLQAFLRQGSQNNTQKVYVLKCDIRKYFASIDHEVLLRLIERYVTDEALLELLRDIVLSHGAEAGKSIPLGNVTSQLFANIYLHELDWYMKQTLGVKRYLRYCDAFLVGTLQLALHPNKVIIRPWNQGIDFLGYVVKPYAVVLRSETRRRAVRCVNAINLSSHTGICAHANAFELGRDLKNIAWMKNDG